MKYLVLSRESSKHAVGNSAYIVMKDRVTAVDDTYVFDDDDVLEFKTKEEALKYIKQSEKLKPKNKIPDIAIDDYLNRNARTVLKALKRDNLDQVTLLRLLQYEEEHKNRKNVIETIKRLI